MQGAPWLFRSAAQAVEGSAPHTGCTAHTDWRINDIAGALIDRIDLMRLFFIIRFYLSLLLQKKISQRPESGNEAVSQ